MAGILYLVSTPIGNLGDMTYRAVEVLRSVDFVAAEDTRVGMKLLSAFDIQKPLVSYYEHNKRERGEIICQRILEGENCALTTDAGTPAISDPGTDLVDICKEMGIEVVSVPGPSAIITALSISGMECGRFCFEGFLSTNKKSRVEHLKEVAREKRTMVFYEAPHKLLRTLEDMLEYWGDRPIALCRELTKLHEEVVRTTLSEAVARYTEAAPKGEFVLIIGGWKPTDEELNEGVPTMEQLLAIVAERVESGEKLSSAVKAVAQQYGVSKNTLYKAAQDME